MTELSEHRRKLTKSNTVRGTLASVSAEGNTVALAKTAGLPLKRLEIKGGSVQQGTPTADAPCAIQSAGDNGLTLELRGKNLMHCGKENSTSYAATHHILSKNSFRLVPLYPTQTLSRYATFSCKVKPNTKIRVSFDFKKNYGSSRVLVWALNKLGQGSGTFVTSISALSSGEGKRNQAITTGSTEYMGIAFYMAENAKIDADAELIVENFMVSYDMEASEFEPYFEPTEVVIPSEVMLSNGTAVPIRLAKYTNADYLEVDGFKSKVRYYQYSTEADPTRPLNEQAENIPPREYDITDTDLGQRLLAIKTPYGLDASVSVSSAVDVSGLSAEYYSLEKEDKTELKISYLSTQGVEISPSATYSVRRGALCTVLPPHIDGYIPTQGEKNVEVNEAKELIIYYEKGGTNEKKNNKRTCLCNASFSLCHVRANA